MHDVIWKLCNDYLEDVWTDHRTRFLQVLCKDSLGWEGLRFSTSFHLLQSELEGLLAPFRSSFNRLWQENIAQCGRHVT